MGDRFTPEQIHEFLFNECKCPQVRDTIADYVYFITDGEFVKVGRGITPLERMKGLQVGNPRELRLLFTIPFGRPALHEGKMYQATNAEDQLHELFNEYHIRGEWYDILQLIDEISFAEYFGTMCERGPKAATKYKEILERRTT